jgi:hypothetical protein
MDNKEFNYRELLVRKPFYEVIPRGYRNTGLTRRRTTTGTSECPKIIFGAS